MELVLVLGILVLLALGAFAAVSVSKRSQRRMDAAERSAVTQPRKPADVEIILPPGDDVEVPPEVEVELREPVVEAPAEPPVRPRLRDRLGKARALLAGYFGDLRGRSAIDDDVWDELEEALIRADVGVTVTTEDPRRPPASGEGGVGHHARRAARPPQGRPDRRSCARPTGRCPSRPGSPTCGCSSG